MNPGVSEVQTERTELSRQHPGFCSSTRTAGVEVGVACRIRMGMYFVFVVGTMMDRILSGRRLRMFV